MIGSERMRGWLKQGWRLLREMSGDDAYERYLAHHPAAHPGQPVLSRRAFFQRQQEQRFGSIKRCC
jgi:uncharacterized short protein YbdD (DUF466 family)